MSLLSRQITSLIVRYPFAGGIALSLFGMFIVYQERAKPGQLVWLGVIFALFGAAMILFHERMFANSEHRRPPVRPDLGRSRSYR